MITLTEKKELRQRVRKKLLEINPEELAEKSLKLCQRLMEQSEYTKAEVVMVFLSLPQEVDTSSFVLRCWQDRKRVLAPKVSWNQRRMMPLEIRSFSDGLVISSLGIREPAAGIPFPISLIDLVVVPGLSFDDSGNRLGRGRGFYDRFLAHPEFHGVACGVAFEVQVTKSLPVDPLDRRVNMLVTEKKVRRFE